jgi:hypothetical protein
VLSTTGSGTLTWTTPSGVTTISGGTTGLTPATATSGDVTLAGTLTATNGGTGQSTYSTGDILYASAANTLSKLGKGTEGQVLISGSTIPYWGSNGLSSFNGYTATTHVLAMSSSTTNTLGWSSNSTGTPATATHTLTIPDATGTVRGFISTASQSFAGDKTFGNDLSANGVYIGRGTNSRSTNIAIGSSANVGGKNFSTNMSATLALNNIAIGVNTLSSLVDGYSNNAVGNGALSGTNGGYNNNAFGLDALKGNTGGYNNSGFGQSTLQANSTGDDNTAVGFNSLVSTTGDKNTAIGSTTNVSPGKSNSTAIGYGATVSVDNTIQLGNTSVTSVNTSGALTTGTVTYPTAHGSNGQVLSTTGSGTLTWITAAGGISGNGTQNYLPKYGSGGTTLGNSLIFDNATSVGINTTSPGSTFRLDVNGAANFSSGIVVNGITIGRGRFSQMQHDQVDFNTAVGIDALSANTTGKSNTAVGKRALALNTTGNENAALGWSALKVNTTGNENLAFGQNTLGGNTTGSANTAIGSASMEASNADGNTGIGASTLRNNLTGNNNTAIGYGAMYYDNTANQYYTSGNNNTAIGAFAIIKSGISNSTAIGQGAYAIASNTIVLGNSSIGTLRAAIQSISSLSDRRDKTDIITISEGLDFLKQLKPVTFTWNTRDKAKVGIKSAGFIAQDLLALQKASLIGANLDLVSDENPDKLEARYNNLLPVMVKAIQEQQKQIEEQNNKIASQQKQIDELKELFNKLLNQNKSPN